MHLALKALDLFLQELINIFHSRVQIVNSFAAHFLVKFGLYLLNGLYHHLWLSLKMRLFELDHAELFLHKSIILRFSPDLLLAVQLPLLVSKMLCDGKWVAVIESARRHQAYQDAEDVGEWAQLQNAVHHCEIPVLLDLSTEIDAQVQVEIPGWVRVTNHFDGVLKFFEWQSVVRGDNISEGVQGKNEVYDSWSCVARVKPDFHLVLDFRRKGCMVQNILSNDKRP